MNARLTFLHALSPLHAGIGQGAGVIDLPIAREKATNLPFLPGSSVKGTLRARCTNKEDCRLVFGPEPADQQPENNHASSIQFSDQRLLLFPVRSLAGIFAWVTSPYVLRRLARDIKDAQVSLPTLAIPTPKEEGSYVVTTTSKLKIATSVYLEDIELKNNQNSTNDAAADAWAKWIAERVFPEDTGWQTALKERFCLIHDDLFSFLLETATEITARIKLKQETKIVEEGALWYEEALPTETILSGLALAAPTQASNISAARVFEVVKGLTDTTLQFGGKATVGRGLCRVLLAGPQAKGE